MGKEVVILKYYLSLPFNFPPHSVTGRPKTGPPVLTPSPVFFPLGREEAELRAWDQKLTPHLYQVKVEQRDE